MFCDRSYLALYPYLLNYIDSCSHLPVTYTFEEVKNEAHPLLGGVPIGRGGSVSSAMTNPPLPLPRGDLMN
jgi:hypothetical protein